MEGFATMLLSGGTPPVVQVLYGIGYFFIYIFIISSMFLTGLSATLGDLLEPVRDRRLLGLVFLVNFILVPLLAVALIALIPMNEQLAGGLLLVSLAAGAPTTMKVAQVTGGNVARAVSLTILMTMVTIVIMPLLLPVILPWAQADPLQVLRNLVLLILVPILLGLFIRSRFEPLADRITPAVDFLSDVSTAIIFLTLGIVFLLRMGTFAGSSSGALAILVSILFTLGALGIGYLLGGLSDGSREEIAFGAGSRNITAALVVIFAGYTAVRNDVLLMVLMVTAFSVIIISILAGILYRRRWYGGVPAPADPGA